MISPALLLIGFSIFSALLLALTHFRESRYGNQSGVRAMGLALIAALTGLQIAHWGWLYLDLPWVDSAIYRILLFSVAPAFWWFSRPLLTADAGARFQAVHLLHALPIVIAPWLPAGIALPLAFIVGSAYLLALARDVYRLRTQRDQFVRELGLLGGVFALAIGIAVLGMVQPHLPGKLFFSLYASAVGLAFLLVQITLAQRPHLPAEVTETAKAAYANSTLARVDSGAMLAQLDVLMTTEKVFQDADLSLSGLAERLHLSPHQLSELINVNLGKGFSRYLREQRIAAAKEMLYTEPSASVLSVGLSVGFSSQSNFYEAFREIEGMTPGQYRKLHTRQ